jgi:hypothetical protein
MWGSKKKIISKFTDFDVSVIVHGGMGWNFAHESCKEGRKASNQPISQHPKGNVE